MPIALSLILRTLYFCSVAFLAFAPGIGVAMSFDAGFSITASLFAFLYLATFVPALLLSAIPLSILTRPPPLLKVWYWWAALLLTILLVFRVYYFSKTMTMASSEIIDEVINSNNYVTICREVIDAEAGASIQIGVGSLKNGFSIERAIQGTQLCSKIPLSKAPFQILYGDPQNPIVLLDIPINPGSKTCIGLTPLSNRATPKEADWTAKVINCAR